MFFIKGTSNIPLLFETVLQVHEIQTERRLIIHVLHISVTRIIEAGIDGLSKDNDMGGII